MWKESLIYISKANSGIKALNVYGVEGELLSLRESGSPFVLELHRPKVLNKLPIENAV